MHLKSCTFKIQFLHLQEEKAGGRHLPATSCEEKAQDSGACPKIQKPHDRGWVLCTPVQQPLHLAGVAICESGKVWYLGATSCSKFDCKHIHIMLWIVINIGRISHKSDFNKFEAPWRKALGFLEGKEELPWNKINKLVTGTVEERGVKFKAIH